MPSHWILCTPGAKLLFKRTGPQAWIGWRLAGATHETRPSRIHIRPDSRIWVTVPDGVDAFRTNQCHVDEARMFVEEMTRQDPKPVDPNTINYAWGNSPMWASPPAQHFSRAEHKRAVKDWAASRNEGGVRDTLKRFKSARRR